MCTGVPLIAAQDAVTLTTTPATVMQSRKNVACIVTWNVASATVPLMLRGSFKLGSTTYGTATCVRDFASQVPTLGVSNCPICTCGMLFV